MARWRDQKSYVACEPRSMLIVPSRNILSIFGLTINVPDFPKGVKARHARAVIAFLTLASLTIVIPSSLVVPFRLEQIYRAATNCRARQCHPGRRSLMRTKVTEMFG